MMTAQTILQWIDLLWVPVAFLAMEKGKKIKTCLYVLSCVLLLRLQVEFMSSMGAPNGLTGWVEIPSFTRGLVVYSIFILLFLMMAHFSKGGDKHVHIAASIVMLILSFCVSSVIMVV
jgi:hypothetical protein